MAVYTLTGTGLQTLTTGTTHLFIDILTLGTGYSTGLSTPTNYFHLGLYRLGFQGYFGPVIPLDGFRQMITLPSHVDTLGYTLRTTTSVQVAEASL